MKLLLVNLMFIIVLQFASSKHVAVVIPSARLFGDIVGPYIAAVVDRIGTMLRNTLSQIPDTENYVTHRVTLNELLQQTEDFKTPSPCLEKALTFSQDFKEFLMFYLKSNDAIEYEKILRLLDDDKELMNVKRTNGLEKHNLVLKLLIENGLMDMQADFEAFILTVKNGKFGAPVKLGTEGYKELMEMKC